MVSGRRLGARVLAVTGETIGLAVGISFMVGAGETVGTLFDDPVVGPKVEGPFVGSSIIGVSAAGDLVGTPCAKGIAVGGVKDGVVTGATVAVITGELVGGAVGTARARHSF